MTKLKTDASLLQSCVSVSVTDLRIGNLLKFGNNICKVYEINNVNYYIRNKKTDESLKSSWAEIEPILITEKLLLKLGFVEVDYAGGCYQKEDITIDMADFNCCYKNDWLEIDVKYIHKLQNLYFALIGSELQIDNLTEH